MSRFLSKRLASLSPYTPGEQPQDRKYIKLNTNENPYPPVPGVFEVINRTALSDLRLYSDPETKAFTEELAKRYNVKPNQVFTGNGSDMVLSVCFQAFCDAQVGATFPDITYSFYPVLCDLYKIPFTTVPLREDFTIAADDYQDVKNGIIVFANPNAPTSLEMPLNEVERMLQMHPDQIVIVDEAYAAFGTQSAVELLDKYENLVVVSTFSKSYNLAGARIGFALSNPAVIDDLNRIKFSYDPYALNRLSLLCGIEALKDRAYIEDCIRKIVATRERVRASLQKLGFTVLESRTNFLFAKPNGKDAEAYFRYLKENGILVRYFSSARIRDYVRITIGTDADMDIVLEKTAAFMKN